MQTQRFRIPTSFLIFFSVCAASVIFGCALTPYFTARPGHDQTSYFLEAERMLSGLELYGPHLTDTNPPTIIWFSALPVLLARWMHAPPMLFLRMLLLILIFGSVSWCVRILRRVPAIASSLGVGLVALAVVVSEFCIGPYNFSQREELLIVLMVPYLLACATGAVSGFSGVERFALGVAAGVAIWFKPQDALVIVGLEVFLALRARSLRRVASPEFLGLVGAGSLVLLLIRLLTPLYFKVVPLLFDTYWGLGTMNTLALALHLHYYLIEVPVALAAYLLFRRSLRDGAGFFALLVCSIAAFVAFDVQHNDWWYHAYPHQALFVIAVAYLIADLFNPLFVRVTSEPRLLRRMAFVVSGFMAGSLLLIALRPDAVLKQGTHQGAFPLDDYLAQYQPSTTVYALSTSVSPLAFSYNHGLSWGGRFAHLWMLPAIIKNELGPVDPAAPFKKLSPETVARLANLQRTELAEDLNYWRPSVVMVEECHREEACFGLEGRDFDMLAWFLKSPEFAEAWSHYRRQTEVANFVVYKLVP